MKSFLNCNIWSVNSLMRDEIGFYEVKRIYRYMSETQEFNTPIPPGFIQIPEFEIKNLHLLETIKFDLVNEYKIPILRKLDSDEWTIDLTYYENTYIQSSDSTQINRI